MKAYRLWSVHPHVTFWVADIPHLKGTKPALKHGVDWGYTQDSKQAIDLTPYRQQRFAAHCRRMRSEVRFVCKA